MIPLFLRYFLVHLVVFSGRAVSCHISCGFGVNKGGEFFLFVLNDSCNDINFGVFGGKRHAFGGDIYPVGGGVHILNHDTRRYPLWFVCS